MKKIIIVGAGPGGLSAGMLLASRGFDVHIFEKNSYPGGRTSQLKLGDYKFDVGPTFFMMKFILDEIFQQCGLDSGKYLDFIDLAPMYRLILPDDREIDAYKDKDKMKAELKRVFGDQDKGVDLFYEEEKKRFDSLMPILQGDNQNLFDVFSLKFLKALPFFSIGRSVFDVMGKYFSDDLAKLTFTFQSKYLGMSPWSCPGAFTLVPYVEHALGVYHIKGGLSEITVQMAKAAEEKGAKIHYDSPVDNLIMDGKTVKGVIVKGENIEADEVIVNADFGYSMKKLVDQSALRKYSSKNLEKKKISCSIFMLYLGVKKQYDLEHNTIVFAKNYKKNVGDIFEERMPDEDISFYVRDTTKMDPGLAPEGKSALYVLVPVPNLRADIDWGKSKKIVRDFAIKGLKERLKLDDIEENIEEEKIITPAEWESDYNVYKGAVFNLAHNLDQMLWFRPHNQFEELKNCYLVGGGTHPGSGLPTIFESGRITTKLICKKYNVNY